MNNALILEQKSMWPHSGSHVDHVALSKPFGKDRRLPLPGVESLSSVDKIIVDESIVDSGAGSKPNLNQNNEVNLRKVQALEKSMEFLQKEHKETLTSLQSEIEKLKMDNNELQFKIIMVQSGGNSTEQFSTTKSPSDMKPVPAKMQNAKATQLEIEIRDLKSLLEEEQKKGKELQRLYDLQAKKLESKAEEDSAISNVSFDLPALNLDPDFPNEIDIEGVRIQLNPLGIKVDDSTQHQPSFHECESIIRLILKSNMQLHKEIQTLKEAPSKSPSLVNSSEISQGRPLSARTHVLPPISAKNAAVSRQPSDVSAKSTRNPANNLNITSCSNSLPYVTKDSKSLPALRQTMGTKIADRKRKTEAIQKRRLEELEKFSK